MQFDQLGLPDSLVRAVREQGYTEPTAIQAEAIPAILAGHDVMAAAQTGTGKTAGFTLPLLARLAEPTAARGKFRPVRALILTPTRELTAQVQESVTTYGRHAGLRSTVIFGGVGMSPQVDRLRRGVDIVVATPGRLLDHIRQRSIDLSRLETLVLDEADRMLDMGFIHDIRKVIAELPKQRQTLLFSATFSNDIQKLALGMLREPVRIEVAPRNTAVETIQQHVHPVDRGGKRALLSQLIRNGDWRQVLVFTRTKHGADRLAKQLAVDNITATAIHGNKSQTARTRALADFKKGSVRVLVATDIAARGLDIDQLPHVVNFELPNVPEDYVHRIGRTGRAGHDGAALSLVCVDELKLLGGIEKLIGQKLDRQVVPGFEPDPNERPQPLFKKRQPAPSRTRQPRPSGNGAPRRAKPSARNNSGQPRRAAGGGGR
ncbi:DEAD/DEAH box helicase [Methylonatrum kenyense]|uniref:DEAD/DEAH box helicase n=1 Tax=Methylonatrum kenyense TaxID=455253 RepID=UPI0020BE1F1F|nr:DEAD/DEAH box helicase [Methylonatrum kenyense]MCK8516021.1 DEAD/DEAH box helicase [Methylonatrum kenyense]